MTAIAIDAWGNILVTGQSEGENSSEDYATVKYSADGTQLWSARYDEPLGHFIDAPFGIAVDNAGNSYVTGGCVTDVNNSAFVTIKYNSDGNQQWRERYTGTGAGKNIAFDIKLDSYNNVYITGISKGTSSTTECATVKYNSAGVQLWAARYGEAGSQSFSLNVCLDNSGGVFISGLSKIEGVVNSVITVKYSQTSGIIHTTTHVPSKYSLAQNYPNPFNPSTAIEFELPLNSFVTLKVLDISGKEVTNLVNENLSAGAYRVDFNAVNLTSGIYFYRLNAGSFSLTKKMILMK